eukprot:TRINITY_DN82186_c0_g1_i1.p1 TRINITY_DN82186_c0_g1~~TRINITY_DN82186_c0_g1_i1.p1  ORF type:complete len:188 (-),score=30.21 TRINITY_DN82186_c0_g1_i1:63-626(-)
MEPYLMITLITRDWTLFRPFGIVLMNDEDAVLAGSYTTSMEFEDRRLNFTVHPISCDQEFTPFLEQVFLASDSITFLTSLDQVDSPIWMDEMLKSFKIYQECHCRKPQYLVFGQVKSEEKRICGLPSLTEFCDRHGMPLFWGDALRNQDIISLCLKSAVLEAELGQKRSLALIMAKTRKSRRGCTII